MRKKVEHNAEHLAVLIHKYYDGVVPAGNENAEELNEITKAATEVENFLDHYEFRNALTSMMNLARFGKNIKEKV